MNSICTRYSKGKEHVLKLLECRMWRTVLFRHYPKDFVNALVLHNFDTPTQNTDTRRAIYWIGSVQKNPAQYNAEIAEQSLIVLSSHNLDDIEQIASKLFYRRGETEIFIAIFPNSRRTNQYVVVRFNIGVSVILKTSKIHSHTNHPTPRTNHNTRCTIG